MELYILIGIIWVIVIAAFAWGMRLAYKQGWADGAFHASMQHTQLVMRQWAEESMRNMKKRSESGS